MWTFSLGGGGGEGGIPLYKPYKYVPPQRVGLLGLFGLKKGIDFAPFWTGVRVWFSWELQERMNVVLFSFPYE